MKIYDTNYYVRHFKSGEHIIDAFFFTDINLFEWLKGKCTSLQFSEFVKIDTLIKANGSTYLFRRPFLKHERILNSEKPLHYRFKIAQKVAKRVAFDLFTLYGGLLFAIQFGVLLKQNNGVIADGFVVLKRPSTPEEETLRSLPKVWKELQRDLLPKLCRSLFEKSKKINEAAWLTFYDSMAQSINSHVSNCALKPLCGKTMNHNTLFVDNKTAMNDEEIGSLIDLLFDFKNKGVETKSFYCSLLKLVATESNRLEFNDIADYYLEYISNCVGAELTTGDNRFSSNSSKT